MFFTETGFAPHSPIFVCQNAYFYDCVSWGLVRPSWVHLGNIWGYPGPSGGHLGAIWGQLEPQERPQEGPKRMHNTHFVFTSPQEGLSIRILRPIERQLGPTRRQLEPSGGQLSSIRGGDQPPRGHHKRPWSHHEGILGLR